MIDGRVGVREAGALLPCPRRKGGDGLDLPLDRARAASTIIRKNTPNSGLTGPFEPVKRRMLRFGANAEGLAYPFRFRSYSAVLIRATEEEVRGLIMVGLRAAPYVGWHRILTDKSAAALTNALDRLADSVTYRLGTNFQLFRPARAAEEALPMLPLFPDDAGPRRWRRTISDPFGRIMDGE